MAYEISLWLINKNNNKINPPKYFKILAFNIFTNYLVRLGFSSLTVPGPYTGIFRRKGF